jgi:4-amino-4-deoxy-L-arabinose transferase-like glycosyltransferase
MPTRTVKLISAAAIGLFIILAVGSSLTHRPQIDEGMFASPAYNLAFHGFFGTTVLEQQESPLTRIADRTYWVMPLFLLNVTAAFKAFGFSLLSMRVVSILYGLLLLLSAYIIASKLARDRITSLFVLLFVSCDYMVLETASSGRMDMMSSALGFAAIGAYLVLRERSISRAVLVSQTLVMLDGLTHPNGILAFLGVVIVAVWLDRHRLSFIHLAVAAVPYLIGGSLFGVWVLQDPQAFKDQFIDNALMGGRMSALSSPIESIFREFSERYPHAYGMQATSAGHSGPIFLKGLFLIPYAAAIIIAIASRTLRSDRNIQLLLVLITIYFLVLSFIDGQKETPYLIHIVPLYLILLGMVFGWLWNNWAKWRFVTIIVASFVVALPAAGMAFRITQNTYGRSYKPAIQFLKQHASSEDVVMGGADLAFGYGFSPNLVSDGRFGFYTGKRPRFIVYDSAVESSWQASKQNFPEFYDYFKRLLNDEYKVAYENDVYRIYERR